MKALFSLLSLLFLVVTGLAVADSARILKDPAEALKLRHHLISNAREEIVLSYFIFAEDETAMEVLSLLRQKARQGVKVKVIVDQLFNDIPKYVATELVNAGVELKNFNKLNLGHVLHSIKYRMHDKLLIADGERLIMGGRNIEDTYYARAAKNYDDRDVYVEGNFAKEARDYYLELWQASHLSKVDVVKVNTKKEQQKLRVVQDKLDRLESELAQEVFPFDLFLAGLEPIDGLTFLHDDVAHTKRFMTGTTKGLYDLISAAQESVLIDSPYLVLTKELATVFETVIARGVKVRITTNSLKATDGLLPQAAYIGQRKKMVQMGIELYEYFGDDSFHSKSLVIDGKIAIIGSFNFDPRSQNLNTETMGVFHDAELARLLTESMNESLPLSYSIDLRGMPTGYDRKFPGVSTKKIVITKLLQFLIIPFSKGLL